jgi:hypothetical protein
VLRGPWIERVLRKCVLKENAFDETSRPNWKKKDLEKKRDLCSIVRCLRGAMPCFNGRLQT